MNAMLLIFSVIYAIIAMAIYNAIVELYSSKTLGELLNAKDPPESAAWVVATFGVFVIFFWPLFVIGDIVTDEKEE